MTTRGAVRAVLALALVGGLAGCAAALPASSYAHEGVRVQGSVWIETSGNNCWTARYSEEGGEVLAPLALPDGYETRDITMSDPSNPGHDIPGPVLMAPGDQVVGFNKGTVVFAGAYTSLDAPELEEQAQRCGWDSAPLVPDAQTGLSMDPDGLTQTVYVCSSAGDEMDPVPDLAECEGTTVTPEPNASTVP